MERVLIVRPFFYSTIGLLLWVNTSHSAGIFDRFNSTPKVLAADQAFQLTVSAADAATIELRWEIAAGYYLYRDKVQVHVVGTPDVQVKTVDWPAGTPEEDPYFGPQAVLRGGIVGTAHLERKTFAAQTVTVKVDYQGCAEQGICYPPLSQTVPVSLPAQAEKSADHAVAAKGAIANSVDSAPARVPAVITATDPVAQQLGTQRLWALPAFVGLGLLLAFTPCIFPMIPILSSLIVGQGAPLSRRRPLILSLVYVLAMSLTYTVAGVIAALLGHNIQAWLQNPWVLGLFSGLFVLLALSMFGLYDLQFPSAWQQRLASVGAGSQSGKYAGVALMGVLSALIVGPCVAPPLVGVLTFIAATGDVWLGGAALFALSMGMGLPLLVLGASAGHWLPKAGAWMERVRSLFGVLLLGVALWMLERVIPVPVSMGLWALLLVTVALSLGALQPLPDTLPIAQVFRKAVGIVLLIGAVLLLVGMAAGGKDLTQPLRGLASHTGTTQLPAFRRVKTIDDVQEALTMANGRVVVLDFYADWCVSCKELEDKTFADPAVRAALSKAVAIQADVTAYDATDRALLQNFGVMGPPTILFFRAGHEKDRAVGFLSREAFLARLENLAF